MNNGFNFGKTCYIAGLMLIKLTFLGVCSSLEGIAREVLPEIKACLSSCIRVEDVRDGIASPRQ